MVASLPGASTPERSSIDQAARLAFAGDVEITPRATRLHTSPSA